MITGLLPIQKLFFAFIFIYLPVLQENVGGVILRAIVKRLLQPAFGDTKILLFG